MKKKVLFPSLLLCAFALSTLIVLPATGHDAKNITTKMYRLNKCTITVFQAEEETDKNRKFSAWGNIFNYKNENKLNKLIIDIVISIDGKSIPVPKSCFSDIYNYTGAKITNIKNSKNFKFSISGGDDSTNYICHIYINKDYVYMREVFDLSQKFSHEKTIYTEKGFDEPGLRQRR